MNTKVLAEYAEQINPLLVKFFQRQKAEVPKSLRHAHRMLNNIEDFCTRGGKRLRPALVCYGYKLLGGDQSEEILKASLTMELIHAFLLIHDDIMDGSDLRRGKKTIHRIYETEYKTAHPADSDPQRFGETMGILAGDLSFCLGFKPLLSSRFPPELKVQAMEKLSNTLIATCFGEELDIRLEVSGSSTPSEVLDVYKLKTAQYTLECPLHIGAILAGATDQDLETISAYAVPCGIAFQIQDDILGMFGDQQKTGKPVGSDLRQGKQTLLIAKALERASKNDLTKIHHSLGNEDLDEADIDEIREIIKKTGALTYCEKLAGEYTDRAKQALKNFSKQGWDSDTILKLDSIADFIVDRIV